MTKLKSFIECSICSDRFGLTDVSDETVTPCGHVYHGLCLAKWLRKSSPATCPECRHIISMGSCRRVYFRYSNDLDSAQSYIDYLSRDLAKKTLELQIERTTKKKLEQDFGGQLKEKDYAIAKLKLKLKERKQRRQLEAEMASSAIIQNNAIFHNLINMNQSGIYPPVQSSNTGTVAPAESTFMAGPASHYSNGANNKYGMVPSFIPNTAATLNANPMLQLNNQDAQQWQQSHMNSMLNATAMGSSGSSGNMPIMPANSVQHSVSNMISNPTINVAPNMSTGMQSYHSPQVGRRPSMTIHVSSPYDPGHSFEYPSLQSYSHAATNGASTTSGRAMQSRSSMAPPQIIDFIDLDVSEHTNSIMNGPVSKPALSSTSSRANATNNGPSTSSQQQQASTSASASAIGNDFIHQMYGHLSANHSVDHSLGPYAISF